MQRLLIRSAKDPFLALTAEAVMARNVVNNNAGNMLFGEAVHKVLAVPGVDIVSNSYLMEHHGRPAEQARRINEEFDAFVLPLANAFRPDYSHWLNRMSAVIERLEVPVVVVGVGVQTSPNARSIQPDAREMTTRFMRAVLDRSAVVGVRGEITASCLAKLGFGAEHVQIIGCPSLYASGPNLTITKRVAQLDRTSPIAVNLTPTWLQMADILNANADRFPNMLYVAQERKELGLLLWGIEPKGHADPRVPFHRDHPMLRAGRVRYFLDPTTWRAFMREQDFAFGTRIHGNIAALMAGTPAHVLTLDSRTIELADYHDIPRTELNSLDPAVGVDEIYARSDFAGFNRTHPENFEGYLRFLEKNGLEHIYGAGVDPAEFDRRLAEVNFPPPVSPILTDDGVGGHALLDRLAWLRQGNSVDAHRTRGAYAPEFTPIKDQVGADVESRVRELERQLDALRKRGSLTAAPRRALGRLKRRVLRRRG